METAKEMPAWLQNDDAHAGGRSATEAGGAIVSRSSSSELSSSGALQFDLAAFEQSTDEHGGSEFHVLPTYLQGV